MDAILGYMIAIALSLLSVGQFYQWQASGMTNVQTAAGREAVAEVVLSTEELMEDFLRGTSLARRNHRLREGSDKSMLGNVMERVLAGRIDPRDAQKNVPIEAYREGV